jgi:hypothetical protein
MQGTIGDARGLQSGRGTQCSKGATHREAFRQSQMSGGECVLYGWVEASLSLSLFLSWQPSPLRPAKCTHKGRILLIEHLLWISNLPTGLRYEI